MTESMRQNLISGVLIIISVVIVLLLTPKMNYNPSGLISPIVSPQAPIAVSDVTAYKEIPTGMKQTGYFSAELYEKENPVLAQQRLVEYARQLAAQIGAHGVVVQLAYSGDMWFLTGMAVNPAT